MFLLKIILVYNQPLINLPFKIVFLYDLQLLAHPIETNSNEIIVNEIIDKKTNGYQTNI